MYDRMEACCFSGYRPEKFSGDPDAVRTALAGELEQAVRQAAADSGERRKEAPFRYGTKDLILLAGLFASAGIGGFVFTALEIPAGMLVGSALAGMAYSILCGKAVYPVKFLPVQQILSGACLGMSVTKETVSGFSELLLPVVIMLLRIVLFSLLSG